MPKVTVGLPVYNGEQFLRQAVNSILGQTFTDLELVIFDNASADGTESICREYAARDARVRYYRNAANLGAGRNYNLTFEHAAGTYFKWAAHDDYLAPDFIRVCHDVLERNPDAALAFSRMVDVDEEGKVVASKPKSALPRSERGGHPVRHIRFHRLMQLDYDVEEIFGLVRSDLLRRTKLFLNYSDSDRTLLAELALYGTIHEVPEVLFFHRVHPESSVKVFPTREERMAWFDPRLAGRTVFPRHRQILEYFRVLCRVPLSAGDRLRCAAHVLDYARGQRGALRSEVRKAWRRRFGSSAQRTAS
ncbi:MAG: glycosyltransferase family 2 protein [Bacteroidota bacterium]